MHYSVFAIAALCCLAVYATAEDATQQQQQVLPALESLPQEGAELTRDKRTLFLKKKLLGAGLLGFGLGVAKGYKFGSYHSSPEVHHVYLSPPPPPVKYVEYVEKPVFVERIVEKPIYKSAHVEYEPAWSQPDPSPVYGQW
ncbi:uncharacterized protein LOC107267220 [Cephus cinctus]|uniref:Uncharacterized protein LOC107267220 n=1 Tax=Cephus cinctus TaxID=211228 RepID=A0AAJ7BTV4_CEPCN|nr:uncharacterized protein LOC107267220 [Cephus cinctus]